MRARPDPEHTAADVFELSSATTTDDLRRVLVMHPPAHRSADDSEPMELLSKHHGIDPAGSAETAMLLVTDPRWRDGAGSLVRRIEESGLLGEDQLDRLAEAFLAAGGALPWPVPDHWFSDEVIVIDFGEVEELEAEVLEDDPEGPALAHREVFPSLRRWAAGRMARRELQRWSRVFKRAEDLDARSAAAVVAGLLDVVDVLEPTARQSFVELACRWPDHSVRRVALGLVAEGQGTEAAYVIAREDPNAGIRKWADTLRNPPPSRPAPSTLF